MAKGRDGTKSQAVREYLTANKDASPKQVVEALKEKGVEVSFGLASAVKYGTKKKGSAKKSQRNVSVKANAAPALSMSDSIRQFIANNPAAGPKDIQAGLKAEGTKVKLSLISAVKYSKAKKGGKKKRTRTPVVQVAARTVAPTALSFPQLIEVKRLADAIGGADQVRHALDALAQLQ